MQNIDSVGIIERLKIVFGCKNDSALASKIGINQSRMSMWKSRDAIDIPFIISITPASIDLNWLLKGEGSEGKIIPESKEVDPVEARLKILEQKIEEMVSRKTWAEVQELSDKTIIHKRKGKLVET